jgi:hypothetical protein
VVRLIMDWHVEKQREKVSFIDINFKRSSHPRKTCGKSRHTHPRGAQPRVSGSKARSGVAVWALVRWTCYKPPAVVDFCTDELLMWRTFALLDD